MSISTTPIGTEPPPLPEPPPPAIDRQALAEKVLALLKREARIERERRGQSAPSAR